MTLLESELRRYQPALFLDAVLPARTRRNIRIVCVVVLVFSGVLIAFGALADTFGLQFIPASLAPLVSSLGVGLFFFSSGVLATLLFVYFFYNSLYFRGIDAVVFGGLFGKNGVTFEVAHILSQSDVDITKPFLRSYIGAEIARRCGVTDDAMEAFLVGVRNNVSHRSIDIPESGFYTLDTLALVLFEKDGGYQQLIASTGVTKEEYIGAVHWVVRTHQEQKYRRRWWSAEQLLSGEGIGAGLAYGTAYELKKYTRQLEQSAIFSAFTDDISYADEVVSRVETTLSRMTEANVLLVGEPGVGKMDILIELGKKMRQGRTATAIANSQLVVFDKELFLSTHGEKIAFENEIIKLLNQAASAGRITLVIENLPTFIQGAEVIGVNMTELLAPYLSSPALHVIATTTPGAYHQHIETNTQLKQHFETVFVERANFAYAIRILEGAVKTYEQAYRIYFLYPALHTLVVSADRYVMDGVMPQKAIDLLSDVFARARERNVVVVDKAFVLETVSKKTGVVVGAITDKERTKLLEIETLMHNRVIGQHEAIEAIASALRRSRTSLQATDKPIASFLFLGSTGVGKTETAKALAYVYFESESNMQRLDMSEFSGDDAVAKLIGTDTHPGVLATLAQEHPYGVLLLDEFEKASSAVHDIFLQVFDEGIFTDGRGQKINLRNNIIIATSNAGSDFVWELEELGKNPADAKGEMVDVLVHNHMYKPELINRFDNIIIFSSLSREEQEKVAMLFLLDLQTRVQEQGYALEITPVLTKLLIEKGYSRQFGAREMRRVLQDEIEERIARKIIAGSIEPGDTITFTADDFVITSES